MFSGGIEMQQLREMVKMNKCTLTLTENHINLDCS